MMFPMYMLAITPQKRSGLLLISKGPGWSPRIIRAPIRMAVEGLTGIPRLRRGIKVPLEAALLAASGPATPSIVPVPNFLRML